jgi:hypothetical protein
MEGIRVRISVSFSPVTRAVFVAALALGLGACGREEHVSAPSARLSRSGTVPHIAAGCPTLTANTLNSASDFLLEFGAIVKFDSRRIRIETSGDIITPGIGLIGPCAAADVPTIRIVGGHANVFVGGTNQSITTTGSRLTFGAMAFPGQLTEPGVLLASDAQGNLLEIIWPDLAGLGPGSPIVRLQLARWNIAAAGAASQLDVAWDMEFVQNGVHQFVKGSCKGMGTDGTPVVSGNAAAPPCPATLGGGGTVTVVSADVVQWRPTKPRFRMEAVGDVASGALNAAGSCAAAEAPTIRFTGGSANVFQAGTTNSVTSTGSALSFGPLLSPGILIEPGVVLATDAVGNVLEIIWPGLAGAPPGAPILRLELVRWSAWVQTGRKIDLTMTFNAVGSDGKTAVFRATAKNITMPTAR